MLRRNLVLFLLMIFFVAGTTLVLFASCGDDDDDNDDEGDDDATDDDETDDDATDDDATDDDSTDDDATDDDATDDDATDDDTSTGECEGYDLTIEGVSHFVEGDQNWIARLDIDVESGGITGRVEPDSEEVDPYDVTGFRHDAETGFLEGAIPTPSTIPPEMCEAETVSNRIDFRIVEGVITQGVVTYYCGEIAVENLLLTRAAEGSVTCGDFAM